jgi:hypothetical protein
VRKGLIFVTQRVTLWLYESSSYYSFCASQQSVARAGEKRTLQGLFRCHSRCRLALFCWKTPVFEEYAVKAEEVEVAATRDVAGIRRDRKAGRLKAWKP